MTNDVKRTAHDRLKSSFRPAVWAAITVSAVAHFAVLAATRFNVSELDTVSPGSATEVVLVRTREFGIPPPPDPVGRPAIPVISTNLQVPDEITISEITFDEPAFEIPPPPLPSQSVDLAAEPAFTPYDIRPRISNQREFERALTRLYPERLKQRGIGGVTILWIFIDENGEVQNTRIIESSGHEALDAAAIEAIHNTARFTPALSRSVRVPVWVQLPIRFVVQPRGFSI